MRGRNKLTNRLRDALHDVDALGADIDVVRDASRHEEHAHHAAMIDSRLQFIASVLKEADDNSK